MNRPPCIYFVTGKCELGLYGGEPHAVNCLACITQGNNNPKFASELFARRAKSHPPNVQKIYGCCDPPPSPAEF